MKDSHQELIQVAYYYYKLNLTQQNIAEKLGISRQKVNRLIQRAIQERIVEIKINGYENFDIDLEYRLEKKYNLQKAIVVKENIDEKPIGIAASKFINQFIKRILEKQQKCDIGISWGNSLSTLTSNYIVEDDMDGEVSVIQLCGGINTSKTAIKPEEVTNVLAMTLGGQSYNLYAPAKMENKELVKLLKREKYYHNILERYNSIDVSVVGIGNLDEDGTLIKYNYLDESTFEELSRMGAVGDVCFRMFDRQGKLVESDYNELIMGIAFDNYMDIPTRIGIAYGREKVKAVTGALCGSVINVLVTDYETARDIMDYDG
ncbi:sugar-binding transcriptional regulator [Proteiniclasticum sp. SCR006]|uniref:Sugar-binding transcriptional regulator n=1 Tax=Proteiniclasticum aestuarii TaxID=2817862 RepID=A0A939HCH3_9CLOT|nr:sugar-binding transcriptional regulator [Proteiniclasticum aestuarii]MBO1265436.1 sugar-binding transcriptional regulator [Proteiniclasticum aestuarii]